MAVVPRDVESTLRMVRDGRTRTFVCETCHAEFDTFRLTGRPPSRCEDCDPQGPGWIRDRTERQMRAAILALDGQVAEQQAVIDALSGAEGMSRRSHRYGRPGRDTLKRAILVVARAEGARGTADALLTLAAIAQAWAAALINGVTEIERAA